MAATRCYRQGVVRAAARRRPAAVAATRALPQLPGRTVAPVSRP